VCYLRIDHGERAEILWENQEAITIAEMAEGILASVPVPKNEILDRALILPEACNYIWTTAAPNVNEPNSALTYYMHLGPRISSFNRVTASLLNQILSEPAYNILRTKEQLGYIVHCSMWHLSGSGVAGIRIVVQSERGPAFLEERVDAFLDGMKAVIGEMKEEEFEEQKHGLERKLTEKVKTVGEETNIFWTHIDSGYFDFLRRQQDAETLKSITKDDIIKLFLSHIHPSSPTRSKLSVHCRSQKPRPKKISAGAVLAFEGLVRNAGVSFDETAWQEELGSNPAPNVVDFENHWKGILAEPAVTPEMAQQLLGEIPSLVEGHPAEVADEDGIVRREGVTYIEDVKAFKASLALSEEPKPLVEWGDLPTSKF